MNRERPPIAEVIGNHVELRKRGRQLWGLCPFHAEKTPSFAVDPEKEVFYCHGCHAGGNVIEFVKLIEGIDFKTAAKNLGVKTYRPSPEQLEIQREAKRITSWAVITSMKICDVLREIGDEISVCRIVRTKPYTDHPLLEEHEKTLSRQWAILCDLDDDLHQPKLAVELWEQRADIDALVELQ